MEANDDAGHLTPRGALRFFASRARSYSCGICIVRVFRRPSYHELFNFP